MNIENGRKIIRDSNFLVFSIRLLVKIGLCAIEKQVCVGLCVCGCVLKVEPKPKLAKSKAWEIQN